MKLSQTWTRINQSKMMETIKLILVLLYPPVTIACFIMFYHFCRETGNEDLFWNAVFGAIVLLLFGIVFFLLVIP